MTAPTGPEPTAPTGPAPTAPTGPEPTAPTGPEPTAPAGPEPTGPSPTGPSPTGPSPTGPSPTGPSPDPTGLGPTALSDSPGAGPVDRYLDEMFDRLAGTGSAGRRMLAETEGHLLDAVADGQARGLDAEAAERAAIDRFGPVAGVVRRVPVAAGHVRGVIGRLVTAAWLGAGIILLWWGGSGVVTWLLGWPWTRLLIATDRFGAQPGMCSRPYVPSNPAVDCFTQYRDNLDLVPGSGDRNTYPWVALCGLVLLAAWLLARRTTVLRAQRWTPAPVPLAIVVAALFGLAAVVLLGFGVSGFTWQAQNWALSYAIAGLTAAVISVTATARARAVRRPR